MVGVQTNVGKKNETTDGYYNKKERDWGERDCARARGKIWDDVRFAFVICTFVIIYLILLNIINCFEFSLI